jgi:hypothetical protein
MQIKPKPPTLNAQIKIHKDNEPIIPVVNNIHAASYKIAKFFNKWLKDQRLLPNTFVTYNSTQLANELTKLKIKETSRLITFEIKDLYVNIPIEETIKITKTQLANRKIVNETISQAIIILETTLKQNYLQFDDDLSTTQRCYNGFTHIRINSRNFLTTL